MFLQNIPDVLVVQKQKIHCITYCIAIHHFNHIRIELMNSVKSAYDNSESLYDKDKKDIPLYGD